MFEMILQTAPSNVQNYLTLKDIYGQLKRDDDFKRITKALARVYLGFGQTEKAVNEWTEVLRLDPSDEEALGMLKETGHLSPEKPFPNGEAELQHIRNQCKETLCELEKAEEAFLTASAKARDARSGTGERIRDIESEIEQRTEKEIRRISAEREHWLNHGQAEVFNQVAEGLKEKADRIIQEDEFNDIRKSVRKAEKLLASTDSVFQQEWQRINEEKERSFREKLEEAKRGKEMKLRSAWQESVARAEQDQAAADLTLRKVKGELRQLQAELMRRERFHQESQESVTEGSSMSQLGEETAESEVVVVAPGRLHAVDEPSEETIPEPETPKMSTDEVGKTLGSILVQHGLVSREHLEEAITRQSANHRPIGQILVEAGYASEEDIINALVAQAGVPYLPVANYEIEEDVAQVVPREIALRFGLVPVDRIANSLLVAMGIPLTEEQKKEVQQTVGKMKIRYFIGSWSDIKAKHERHY
jgi:tetratricopeptide (TPR) repeat protein